MSEENEPSDSDAVTDDGSAAAQPAEPSVEQTVRRPGSAAAAAATRARRIGGRPVAPVTGAAKPADDVDPAVEPVVEPTETVPTSAPAAKRGRFGRAAKNPETDEQVTDNPTVVLSKPVGSALPPVPAAGAAAPRPSGRSDTLVRWIPAAVLGVAAIVMAIVLLVSTHGVNWARANSNAQRDQVLAAAKSCVAATNTYSYKDLDAFEKKGLACATGSFATQFKNSVDKILRKGAPPVKQVQSLQINTAGLMSVSKSNVWQVLVYGQISVTNTSTTSARIDPFGAVATMKKVGGSWRLTTLCSQSLGGTTDSCY